MSRPVDEERPGELLRAILDYLVEHGITDLSLRPLAKGVGSSPRVLLYHFGSREQLLVTVLAELGKTQRGIYSHLQGATFAEVCGKMWQQISSPTFEPSVRLFFEVIGMALRQPEIYQAFLNASVKDWLAFSVRQLHAEGYRREEARLLATIVTAGFRGFLLDLCATHDRKRVNRAVSLWLQTLDKLLPPKKRA